MSTSSPSTQTADLPPIIAALRNSNDIHSRTRNVIICLDGTGDEFDSDNSNVVKFFAALKKDDPTQLTYYQSGVGTYSSSYKGSLKSGLSAALDMAVGASLGVHVREAYSFLMQNYREGDKICIIGFSRGAYTARALAGMLHKVGLLPAHNQAQIPFAYKWYRDDSSYGWDMSADFKRTFSIDADVHFLGCWDTVASVGIIPRILPFAKTNNRAVRYFRHALALDERRAKFKANHWYQRDAEFRRMQKEEQEHVFEADSSTFERALNAHHKRAEELKAIEEENERGKGELDGRRAKEGDGSPTKRMSQSASQKDMSSTKEGERKTPERRQSLLIGRKKNEQKDKQLTEFEMMRKFNEVDEKEFGEFGHKTDVLEVWFLGCHADCGGGAVPNETRHMVSRIPLRWMIRQTFECDTGILFHTDVLAEHGLDVDTLWPQLIPRQAPACGPPPSALDGYDEDQLPTMTERRNSVRRRMALNELYDSSLVSSKSSNTLPSLKTSSAASSASQWYPAGVLPESHEDYFDSLADINDQLEQAKFWWILELWPVKYRVKKAYGQWTKKTGPNMGRYRTIRTQRPNVHWTVVQRQENAGYKIKCELEDGCSWNVVY